MSNLVYRAQRGIIYIETLLSSCQIPYSVTQPDVVSYLLWQLSVRSYLDVKCNIGIDMKIWLVTTLTSLPSHLKLH